MIESSLQCRVFLFFGLRAFASQASSRGPGVLRLLRGFEGSIARRRLRGFSCGFQKDSGRFLMGFEI